MLIHKLPFLLLFLLSLLFSLLVASPTVFAVTIHTETVNWAQWPEPANGASISALPQVRQIIRLFEEDENITIEIHHPSDVQNDVQNDVQSKHSGKSWAESLGRWLVTFGIPIHYVVLFADSADHQITISLVDRR